MPAPAIYLDNCVDVRLAVSLRQRGFTVRTTAEEKMYGAKEPAGVQQLAAARLVDDLLAVWHGPLLRVPLRFGHYQPPRGVPAGPTPGTATEP
jgi:hypothetical protein